MLNQRSPIVRQLIKTLTVAVDRAEAAHRAEVVELDKKHEQELASLHMKHHSEIELSAQKHAEGVLQQFANIKA